MSKKFHGRIVKDVFNNAKSGRNGLIEKDKINWRNVYGVSALMMSVMQNNISALKTLISAGADINLTRNNSIYITALTIAVERGRVECVKELIRAGAFFTCERGLEALKMARDHSFLDAVVEGDIKCNHSTYRYSKPCNIAYSNKCFDLLVDLINCGISTSIEYLKFEDFARTEIFNALINSTKTDINKQYWDGKTMFLKAVEKNAIHIVRTLLEKGVNVNQVDQQGNTALHFAYGGKSDIISLLLKAGANTNLKNIETLTPLHIAAIKSDTEMMIQLIEANGNIDICNQYYQTPLSICIENSDLKTTTCLLQHGAEVNKVQSPGTLPLITAVEKEDERLIAVLIEYNADVNYTDHENKSPLIYAVLQGNTSIVSLLIQAGADVNIKTADFSYQKAPHFDLYQLVDVKSVIIDSGVQNVTPLHIAAQFSVLKMSNLSSINKRIQAVETVNILLKAGADVQAIDENCRTPLHIAAIYGDLDIVKSLCQSGTNINAMDKFGNTPFFLSILYDHRELAKYLMEFGADVNLMSESQCSPLCVAVFYNDTELVPMLIKHGALADKGKQSELLLTFKRRNSDLSMLLLKNGADANVRDEIQTPALIICLKLMIYEKIPQIRNFQRSTPSLLVYGRKRVYCPDPDYESSLETAPKVFVTDETKKRHLIESMLQHGANVFLTDSESKSCLHVAARYCSTDILELCIRHKAEVNKQNLKGKTPLMIACMSGKIEAAESLLQAGANVLLSDRLENTALHYTVQNHIELFTLVKMLLAQLNQNGHEFKEVHNLVNNVEGMDNTTPNDLFLRVSSIESFINMKNQNGENVLHIACELKHFKIIKFLVRKRCNIESTTSAGKTPLMIASTHRHSTVAKFLMEHRADVNIRDNEGETALHVAVSNGNLETATALIENGANVNNKNVRGQTPFFCANSCEIIQFLIDSGAEVNKQDYSGETTLYFRAKKGDESVVNNLLERGAMPDITTNEGITVLMYAAEWGNTTIVKSLIKHGASVNTRDCEGRNACMYAIMGVRTKSESQAKTYQNLYGYTITIDSTILLDKMFEIIDILISAGADLNILDSKNRSLVAYTLEYVDTQNKKECIEKILSRGVNPILHENHRNLLLSKVILLHKRPSYEEKCMHNVLIHDSKIIFQFFLINGITLSHSGKYYFRCSDSNFRCAVLNKKFDFLRFFLATGFIFTSDLKSLRNDKYFKDDTDDNLDTNESLHNQLLLAKREPWPLVKLAFIKVSTILGTGPMREKKLKQTKLPPRLQRTLMFQEPISRLPVEDWSKIPLCFDPVQYETLPCPRPLLYYWPVGHRLVI